MINRLCLQATLNKTALLLFSILLSTNFTQAQNTKNPTPLRSVLTLIEAQYQVSFTYADATIEHIEILPPVDSLPITEVIDYLNQNTSLFFTQLDERFIIINTVSSKTITICGNLMAIDKQTTVVGATIQVGDQYDVSNANGFFKIENVPINSMASIRVVGYEQLKLPTLTLENKGECASLYLTPIITQLKEVMIRNYITTGINKQVNGAFNVGIDQLGILPGLIEPDVLQAIQVLPGIQSIDETVSHLNVRGGTNDQNLVLWDGIKMYQTGHFFGLISAFNPYQTKEVTLIKNGTDAHLGESVSSTIDIQSTNTLFKTFSGQVGISLINADALLNIPVSKKISLQLSGRISIPEAIPSPVYTNYFERVFGNTDVTKSFNPASDTTFNSDEHFFFYDVGANLLYDINSKNKLQLNFLNLYNRLNYQENIESNTASDSKTSELIQKSIATGLNYSKLWNNHFSTSAQFYLSSYTLSAVNYDIVNNQRLIQENEVLDASLKLDASWSRANWGILGGYQYQENGIGNLEEINNPEFKRYTKEVIRTHAVFTEFNFVSSSNQTNIKLGVRANYFTKFNRVLVEPRLSFNQKFLTHFSVELLGELKSQTATQIIDLQTAFLGVEKRRWVLANEKDIPILKSKQVSTGVYFNKNKLLISIEGFYKFVSGITSSSQGFQNQFQYIRSPGNYNVAGVEFLVNKQFKHFSTWVGYSYTDNTYDFTEFNPSMFPNNLDITNTTTVGVNAQLGKFQVSAGVNTRTGKPYTLPASIDGREILYQTPNSERLPDYLRVDFSAKFNFNLSKKVKAQLGASVWNLTDNKNIINIYYQLDDKGEIQEIQKFALGLTPNIMFRVLF